MERMHLRVNVLQRTELACISVRPLYNQCKRMTKFWRWDSKSSDVMWSLLIVADDFHALWRIQNDCFSTLLCLWRQPSFAWISWTWINHVKCTSISDFASTQFKRLACTSRKTACNLRTWESTKSNYKFSTIMYGCHSHSIVVFAVRRTIRTKSCYVVQPVSWRPPS